VEKLARDTLKDILDHMGYSLDVKSDEEEERILLDIVGEDCGELIGKKGQTLDALQFLLGRILSKKEKLGKPVVVDSGGYRKRRADALEELALRLGEKASKTGKVVAVNPMSAHDRRIIHMALKEIPGVSTRSEGEGFSRRLLIVPEQE
jgi:spoIIIJ-associated protein